MMTRTAVSDSTGDAAAAVSSYRGGPDGGRDAGLVPIASASAIGIGGQSGFGVAPTQLPDGQARPYFTESVASGHSAVDTAVITNRGSKTLALVVSASTGITASTQAARTTAPSSLVSVPDVGSAASRRPSPWPRVRPP